MITTFEIDQTKIDAPDFPRSLEWWKRFVPPWGLVVPGPGDSVRVKVSGSSAHGRAMGDWLRTAGTSGRLADAVTEL